MTTVADQYVGPSGGLKKDSPWLASEDVGLSEMRVTIQDVLLHRDVKFEAGRVEPKVASIKFVGVAKEMILNATNRKKLGKLFTLETANWRGRDVVLFVDPNVKQVGGGVGNGLRIKEAAPLPPSELTNLPEAWLDWTNEQRGEHVARRGTADFRKWWKTLPGLEREPLAGKTTEWKEMAEKADTEKSAK
jgi:hypothetical protein